MRNLLIVTTVICSALVVTVMAVPVPEAQPDPEPAPAPEPKTDIELMKIPLDDDKELDVITLVDSGDQKINERNKRTIGILRELFPTLSQINSNSENLNTLESLDLAGLSDTLNAIRVARATEQDTKAVADVEDQKGAESSAKSSALDELSLDSDGNDEDRNKRFLSFGGGSSGAGGSGNFLFDIIRLVSGSSGTEHSDEKANSPDDHDNDHELGKGDGYTEGIPGPVTRLFVLANRGLSNLIQDLILRIAQTSERVVNFKARLITSLI
ncbi:clumping factor B isoform X2 [Malaya genurostris]|uniref:clumping factor B isoform X2 n=1 Tax=Malaya genurostris TaxID=325434 RepID=UPI0026F3857C|nr:clumping factor B isoform X2 [Malaya genurostris]